MIYKCFLGGLLVCTMSAGMWASAEDATPLNRPDIKPPFDMPEVKAPVFPDRTVDIRDHGAVGDGKTLNTKAIARAIAACTKLGGGHVVIPKGTWLTGAVHLKSNIDLHLEKDAVLRFSTNPEDYLPVVLVRWAGIECYNYSPLIYARDCTNIGITGQGRLDGQREKGPWEAWVNSIEYPKKGPQIWETLTGMVHDNVPVKKRVFGTPQKGLRPHFICPIGCKNVLIEGISLNAGPFWTIDCVYCENVLIRKVSIEAWGSNADGVDLDSSRNVVVEHCTFATSDDFIALKSGLNEDGWRVGRPTENVIVRHCHIKTGCGVVIGSDVSGGVRNVLMHDLDVDWSGWGLWIKSNRSRGGAVENIWYQDITMRKVKFQFIYINTAYGMYAPANKNSHNPTLVRNIHFKNITCKQAGTAIDILGQPDRPIENVSLENVSISADTGLHSTFVNGLKLVDCRIESRKEPAILLNMCRDVLLQRFSAAPNVGVLLQLEHPNTRNIRLLESGPIDPKRLQFGRGVDKSQLQIEPHQAVGGSS